MLKKCPHGCGPLYDGGYWQGLVYCPICGYTEKKNVYKRNAQDKVFKPESEVAP